MKLATRGDKPDWYEVPADVERVAVCRISGARASEGCRHQVIVPMEVLDSSSSELASSDVDLLAVAPLQLAPTEPAVYQDYFPIGMVPPGLCPLHGAATPIVDVVITPPGGAATEGTAQHSTRVPSSRSGTGGD